MGAKAAEASRIIAVDINPDKWPVGTTYLAALAYVASKPITQYFVNFCLQPSSLEQQSFSTPRTTTNQLNRSASV